MKNGNEISECSFCKKVFEVKNKKESIWGDGKDFSVGIVSGHYTGIDLIFNKEYDELYLVGVGDDQTEPLHIKFCPECGKLLK